MDFKDVVTDTDIRCQHIITTNLRLLYPKANLIGEEDQLLDDFAASPNLKSEDSRNPEKVQLLAQSKNLFSDRQVAKSISKRFHCFTRYSERVTDLSPKNQLYDDPIDFLNDEVNEEDLSFWIDPLDGTGGFVQGHTEHVTCNIGIAVKGKPLFGVIGKPFVESTSRLSQTYVGGLNIGLHKITGVEVKPWSKKRRVHTIYSMPRYIFPFSEIHPSHPSICAAMNRNQSSMDRLFMQLNPRQIERVAGAGNKFLHLASGKSDLYVNFVRGLKLWDTCAGDALIKARFGLMTNGFLEHIDYNPLTTDFTIEGGLIASSTACHLGSCHAFYTDLMSSNQK